MNPNASPDPIPARATVAIVGAGPAGLGVARVLHDLAIPDVVVLERGAVGQSFRDWPEGTRLLTPSFPGNVFGVTDLNAISYDSSPGWALKREHPDGPQYAAYLEQAAEVFGLKVCCGVEVLDLLPAEGVFLLTTSRGELRADFVIWAGGHFGSPWDGDVIGAEHGIHTARVRRWRDVEGGEICVIGGYESGIDAALGLIRAGKRVTLLGRGASWKEGDKDPSRALSPFTRQRLDAALEEGAPLDLVSGADVVAIYPQEGGGFRILSAEGRSWTTKARPLLATGFQSGLGPAAEWFDEGDGDLPRLTLQDESTLAPGLFLVGPDVAHNGHLFCFIYKFRQRFAVVARAIAGRLGVDEAPLEAYRANNMYLDDLACCDADKCLC